MKTYYVSIRGLKSKKESLEEILDEVKPDIIGLVETHMEQGEELRIEGYHIIRKDRNGQGGGLLIAVKDQQKDNVVKREEDETKNLESLWIEMGTQTKYQIGITYAPQGEKARVKEIKEIYKGIEEQVKQGQAKENKILIMGDFNAKIESIQNKKKIETIFIVM